MSEDDEPVIEDMPERPVRQRRPPDRYGEWVTLTRTSTEPTSVKEVMNSPNKEKWEDAMKDELKSLQKNDVWELVKLPNGRKTVGSKWVFKEKIGDDGSIERYKVRLVAQGYSQQRGLDYDETFSPVVRTESVRALIALAAKNNMILHQLDVTTAFLNGTLDEEIYMKQPEGFEIKGKEHLVCKLRKSIYGLKQASRCWNTALHAHLCTIGFCQSDNDPCIYVSEDGMVTLAVYVEDIILGACGEKLMKEVKQAIGQKFITRDMGELEYFLGVAVNQNKKSGAVWIGQPMYTRKVIKKFNMRQAKPVATPVDSSVKLTKAEEDSETIDQGLYQSAVGCLLYLSTWTQPDIAFAVSNVAKFCSNPSKRALDSGETDSALFGRDC